MSYQEYINPTIYFIIPTLNIIGTFIKKSPIKDKYIPWILGVIGIAISITYMLLFSTDTIPQKIFNGIVQGILCSGMAVYANQLVKQTGKTE